MSNPKKPIFNRSLNDTFIETQIIKPPYVGKVITDTDVPGLQARATKRGRVAFRLRSTIHKKKEPFRLGDYHPIHNNVDIVRTAARAKLNAFDPYAAAHKLDLTLDEMLTYVKTQHLAGDKKAQRHFRLKNRMPKRWEENVRHVRVVLAPILHHKVRTLRPELINATKNAYLIANFKRKHIKLEENAVVPDANLHSAFSALQSTLGYAADLGMWKEADLCEIQTSRHEAASRFLLLGEFQRTVPFINRLPHEAGLFWRFLLFTAARVENALEMTWADIDPPKDMVIEVERDGHPAISVPTAKWVIDRAKMKGGVTVQKTLIGETLRIVEHFRQQKETSEDTRLTVFPDAVIQVWASLQTAYQRVIEQGAKTVPYNRKDLRRTCATYLKAVGLDQALISNVLSHAGQPSSEAKAAKAAEVTKVYVQHTHAFENEMKSSLGIARVEKSGLRRIARAQLTMQELFRDIEAGRLSPLVAEVTNDLDDSEQAAAMISRYKVGRDSLRVKDKAEFDVWLAANDPDAWQRGLTAAVNKERRRRKAEERKAEQELAASQRTAKHSKAEPVTGKQRKSAPRIAAQRTMEGPTDGVTA